MSRGRKSWSCSALSHKGNQQLCSSNRLVSSWLGRVASLPKKKTRERARQTHAHAVAQAPGAHLHRDILTRGLDQVKVLPERLAEDADEQQRSRQQDWPEKARHARRVVESQERQRSALHRRVVEAKRDASVWCKRSSCESSGPGPSSSAGWFEINIETI